MKRSSLSAAAIAVSLAAGLGSAASAGADPGPGAELDERATPIVPRRCAAFAPGAIAIGTDRPRSEHEWRQLLSLAACAQDGAIGAVRDLDQLRALVEDMTRRLALPMLIYIDALEHGDAPVQLRAAFQIGMAYVALSTRARSSIAAPPGPAGDGAAASSHRELHARLERMLVPARRAAWVSLHAIDEAAALDAGLATNEVERNIVRTARQLLPALRDAAPEEQTLQARRLAPRGEGAPGAAPSTAPVTAALAAAER